MKPDPAEVIHLLSRFTGQNLTSTLGRIESAVRGISAGECDAFLKEAGAGREVLTAAAEMKRLAGQINVTIHALGILLCLSFSPIFFVFRYLASERAFSSNPVAKPEAVNRLLRQVTHRSEKVDFGKDI
jgi:hypothetical protein